MTGDSFEHPGMRFGSCALHPPASRPAECHVCPDLTKVPIPNETAERIAELRQWIRRHGAADE